VLDPLSVLGGEPLPRLVEVHEPLARPPTGPPLLVGTAATESGHGDTLGKAGVDLFARTSDPDVVDTEWSDLAERTEAVAMERFVAETDPNTRAQLGMETRRGGDGVLTTVLRDPMGGY